MEKRKGENLIRCVVTSAMVMIASCHRSESALPVQAESDNTRLARHAIEVDANFLPGKVVKVDDLAYSAPVLRTAARDTILLGRSSKCWPETRDNNFPTAAAGAPGSREAVFRKSFGESAGSISCQASKPENLPVAPSCCEMEGIPISPQQQFESALPLGRSLEYAIKQGEVPISEPVPIMRRRWRSEVRIRPTEDPVFNAALETVIKSKPFIAAVHDLPIRITSEHPNSYILAPSVVGLCKEKSGMVGPCNAIDLPDARGSLDGIRRRRDPLARLLTNGRRTWFEDGSDFGAAVRIGRERLDGFTVGSRDTIEGAACFIDDSPIGGSLSSQWRTYSPQAYAAQPAYRQRLAALCLLRVLGVSGATWDMKRYPRFDDRQLDLVPGRNRFSEDETVVVGRLAIHALSAIYAERGRTNSNGRLSLKAN